ncbi:hypothetical protein ACFOWE_31270 [Planomonospora corallina]|uniref:Uncharacterized protein n=1 Tax=Planomonospora corallina TaxID=1806052 RepID=A0ABV8IFP0_9ACTN
MAAATRDGIARLLPDDPPGATLGAVYQAAGTAWPGITLGPVRAVLHALVADGRAVRTGGAAEPHRYHLSEAR